VDQETLLRAIEISEVARLDFAEAYLVAIAESADVDQVVSSDQSIDRVSTVRRVEPWLTALNRNRQLASKWVGTARVFECLASFSRLVRFDALGGGQSDPLVLLDPSTLEQRQCARYHRSTNDVPYGMAIPHWS
jgi:hypothetical protein